MVRKNKLDQNALRTPDYGALVISLDFELHWGVRDKAPADGPYRRNLIGARDAVPRLLDLFAKFGVGATWATVGFLFARNKEELEHFAPRVRPQYRNPALDAYREAVGEDERTDPLHYASSLIDRIVSCPRQELATHTFSHYYCREAGQTEETFRSDIESAVDIAKRYGVRLRSIVFPRNQFAPEYAPVLREFGISIYREAERSWMYQGNSVEAQRTWLRRGARLMDNYLDLSGPNTTGWAEIPRPGGLFNVPSSRFLRPYSNRLSLLEPLRLTRILNAMEVAAARREIFHLNWHPHNFGVDLEENMEALTVVLARRAQLYRSHGMEALSMAECVDRVSVEPEETNVEELVASSVR